MASASVENVMAGNSTQSSHMASWIFRKLGTDTHDARTDGWLFMNSPWTVLILTAAYLVMCVVGPKIMVNKKPSDLRSFIVFYNFALVILSLYMFLEILVITVFNPKFNLACSPVDYSDDPYAVRLLSVLWVYFISKGIEFIETLVFLLRKKNNQISFLHVYHHSTMFVLWWLTVRHCGGGSAYFSGLINSLVHVVMYTYYMLSAMGDSMRPYLWWKKYLTRFQLVQFWCVTLHITYTIYKGCGFPTGYAWLLFAYMFTQKALFMNFYMKAYRSKQTTPPPAASADGGDVPKGNKEKAN